MLHLKSLQDDGYICLWSTLSLLLIHFIHSSLYLLILCPCLAPFSPNLVTTNLFSVSVSLFLFCNIHLFVLYFIFYICDTISYTVFLYQTYFAYLQVYPCCCKWQNFVLFYGWVVFYYIYSGIFFINSSIRGYLDCSHKLAVAHNAAYKHWVHVSFSSSVSDF